MKIGAFLVDEPVPELRDPHVISVLHPWIDAGSAGTLTLKRLEERLGAKDLARLERPSAFFDFTRYRPMSRFEDGERRLDVPNTVLRYARGGDLPDLLFCHLLEPHLMAEQYVDSLAELFRHFKVRRHFRIGAMLDAVPHTRPLRLTGTLQGEARQRLGKLVEEPRSVYEGPTSITMGLLGQVQETLDIESMSLMLHLPQYLQLDEDYTAAARLLEAVGLLYGMPLNFPETARGKRQYRRASAELENARNAEVRRLITQLEEMYDSMGSDQTPQAPDVPNTPLAPEVQRFLQGLDVLSGDE